MRSAGRLCRLGCDAGKFPVYDDAVSSLYGHFALRFEGREEDGSELHELRAAHVAEVLQGLVGLSSDFAKAGVFADGPAGSEVLVRPAEQGSFLIEVIRVVQDNAATVAAAATAAGVPTLSQIVWWATREARADVEDFEYLANGNVKVSWQDKTSEEVPEKAWRELQKRSRRRKRHLRQIMAPLSDERVTSLEVEAQPASGAAAPSGAQPFTLVRSDYDAVRPEDEIDERENTFVTEAQMSAVDFDDPAKWRVKTPTAKRAAIVEDEEFLRLVKGGLAIRSTDIFKVRVREDTVIKNGRTRRKWTVLKVEEHRRAAGDDDS